MAFFGVTVEEIGSVAPIEGADRIEVATLKGKDFQFVIGKGAFAPGDRCLYFPIDSLLPAPVAEALGVAGKLAGRDKNRVKTVKLRGQISQGIVAPLSLAPAEAVAQGSEALTAHFGVAKYDPPEIVCNDATLVELPDGVSVYDIEGADRYTAQAALLAEGDVMITEKVEGSNFSVLARPDGELLVNQRTKTIVPREGVEHTFWKIARERRVLEFARSLSGRYPGQQVLVYGEALGPGIQGNLYKLKTHEVRFFDIRVGARWLGPQEFLDALASFYGSFDAVAAPVLHRGPLSDWLAGRSIKEASNGRSKLADVLREGVVIRPEVEQQVPEFGRLLLKQRSPEYLAKSDILGHKRAVTSDRDALPRLWVLNLDAELELADPGYTTPSGAMRERMTRLRGLLSGLVQPGDIVLDDPPQPGPLLRARGVAWCPTPRALRLLASRLGSPPEAPPLAVLRAVNHRRFCASLGQTLPAARFVDDLSSLREALAAPSPSGTWLLKRPLGFAGRGQLRVDPGPLTEATRRWAAPMLDGEGLQVEPLVERIGDFSIHGMLGRDGSLALGRPTRQRCSAQGVWESSEPAGTELLSTERQQLEVEARRVAAALHAAGYFGPFNVDAFAWRDGSAERRFNPRCEVNARYSMGFAASGLTP